MASFRGFPNLLILAFHIIVFAISFYGLVSSWIALKDVEASRTYGGRWKFLTFLDQIFQTVYFGFTLLNDLLGSSLKPWENQNNRSVLQKIRDVLLASVAFPMGAFVVSMFWVIYTIDRELVFPKELDAIIPPWLNHVMHTTILPFLLLDKYFTYHHYPSKTVGMTLTVCVGLVYQLWVLWIAYHADIWVYPVLQVLSWPGRLGFFAALWVMLGIIYMFGEYFTKTVWEPTKTVKAKKIQ